MTDIRQIDMLRRGNVSDWNAWRKTHATLRPELAGGQFAGLSLREVNLVGANLRGANLVGIDFTDAILNSADLSQADLRGAILDNAKLWGTNLSQTDLSEAHLSGASLKDADLRGANMYHAYLQRANLENALLGRVNLSVADLNRVRADNADFSSAILEGAHLKDAHLSNAKLRQANLISAEFSHANLRRSDFSRARLNGSWLTGANLAEADLTLVDLSDADVRDADLTGADLRGSSLYNAKLNRAKLQNANLNGANLRRADLSNTDLTGADLSETSCVRTNICGATLTGCIVYGISVWDLMLDSHTIQKDLRITPPQEDSTITVDNLEVSQFLYLLLHNQKLRDVLDTITSKMVLILGRFSEERKPILDALRDALRRHPNGYVPILFDFEPQQDKPILETVKTLANLARFVIADLTSPNVIRSELTYILPNVPSVPVQPIILETSPLPIEYGTWELYRSFLPIYRYENMTHLLGSLEEAVVNKIEGHIHNKD